MMAKLKAQYQNVASGQESNASMPTPPHHSPMHHAPQPSPMHHAPPPSMQQPVQVT